MRSALNNDEKLIKVLIPSFPLSCRRMTPGIDYLESLTKPNARVVTESIARVVPDGLVLDSGEHIVVDAVICATGFDVSFRPRFPIVGRGGNLQDVWARNLPKAYMSCAVPDMPNYFGKLSNCVDWRHYIFMIALRHSISPVRGSSSFT